MEITHLITTKSEPIKGCLFQQKAMKILNNSLNLESLLIPSTGNESLLKHYKEIFKFLSNKQSQIVSKHAPKIPILLGSNDQETIQLTSLQIHENNALLLELQGDLNDAVLATQTISTISRMQAQIIDQLNIQNETIRLLENDSVSNVLYVQDANKNLLNAEKYFGFSNMWIMCFLLGASFLILVLDRLL